MDTTDGVGAVDAFMLEPGIDILVDHKAVDRAQQQDIEKLKQDMVN
jgi:hypothetical protein